MAQLGPRRTVTVIMALGLATHTACSSEVDHRPDSGAGVGGGGTSGSVVPNPSPTGSGGQGGAVRQDPCDGKPCGAACCDDPREPCFSPGNSKACDVGGACIEADIAIDSCAPETECCERDFDCGDESYVPCVEGMCKQPILDACWVDAECPNDCVCEGEFVCPCGYDCDSEDVPGFCACSQAGG